MGSFKEEVNFRDVNIATLDECKQELKRAGELGTILGFEHLAFSEMEDESTSVHKVMVLVLGCNYRPMYVERMTMPCEVALAAKDYFDNVGDLYSGDVEPFSVPFDVIESRQQVDFVAKYLTTIQKAYSVRRMDMCIAVDEQTGKSILGLVMPDVEGNPHMVDAIEMTDEFRVQLEQEFDSGKSLAPEIEGMSATSDRYDDDTIIDSLR